MPPKSQKPVPRTQHSLPNVPPPEIGQQRKSEPAPVRPKPQPRKSGGDLFIVDNSDEQWKVAEYLREWCDLAKSMDIASGYFEIGALLALDGDWQKLENIRILMGDEVSRRTQQAFNQALQQVEQTLDASIEKVKEENDFLNGVPAIVKALENEQIKCKVYRERKFHAKAYITHSKFEVMGSTALVGSSNFTYPGLHDNIELNVRIRNDVEELQDWYENYWNEAEDVTPDIIRVIERHTRAYTPFEVYAKALYEFFKGHELTAGEWEKTESKIYPILDHYQKEGYHALMKIAARYNGALLCDSVGLGKTFIGMMVIERLLFERKRVALIVPKAAREPVWERKLRKHMPGLTGAYSTLAIFNHTDLLREREEYRQLMEEVAEKADAVVIDEAHHFRNINTDSYRKLFSMLDGKQVFLLTATPINNSLLDLQHMIELFSRRQPNYFGSAPLGIHSLTGHFRTMESALKKLVGEREDQGVELSMAEAEQILSKDDLFRALVVQRSRAYARKSQEQNGGQAVIFPDRESPTVVHYSLKKTYGRLLDLLDRAFKKEKPLLSLAIYSPLSYPRSSDEEIDAFALGRQNQVVGLIRTLLLKRFESSEKAFEDSCIDLLLKLIAFVELNSETPAEKRWFERWKAQKEDVLEWVRSKRRTETDEETDEDVIPVEIPVKVEKLSRKEFRVEDILNDTHLDMDQLVEFLVELKDIGPADDDKLQSFIRLLQTDPMLSKNKVLIFSEYMSTARYLEQELRKAGIGPLDEVDSSTSEDRGTVITRFAPYYNESSSVELKAKGQTETRVLISTDVLSEGLNLQDATLLINYDLHWNPVRLMQRIGRVDRRMDPAVEEQMLADHPEYAGTRGKVHFWNFLPPDEMNSILSLYERVTHKTLRISKTFGIEGKQLLTPDDDYQALREFTQAYEGTTTSEEAMHLAFRDLLNQYPWLEDLVKTVPLRVFSGRAHPNPDSRAVFFCYSLPAKNPATGLWDEEAAFTRWYLYDLQTGNILEDSEQINQWICSTPDTPRQTVLEQDVLVTARKKVERHITNSYLRAVQAPVGEKQTLKAWMELS